MHSCSLSALCGFITEGLIHMQHSPQTRFHSTTQWVALLRICAGNMGLFSLLTLILLLAGCSTIANQNTVYMDASQRTIYKDQLVSRTEPIVHVYPKNTVDDLRVLMLPFSVTQKIENADLVGYSISRIFWQTWAGMQSFHNMEFVPDAGRFRRDRAIALGRAKGADMVIGGFVTYILDGGTRTQSQLAVQIEAYDVASGLLVWSFAQSGNISAPEKNDFALFTIESRMPASPIYAIAATLATDSGEMFHTWNNSSDSALK